MDISVIEGMKAADWAAWIQAIGSVVAIAAAALIAGRQTRDTLAAAEADRKRRELVMEETLLSLAKQFTEEVRTVETCYATPIGAANFTQRFKAEDLFALVEASALAIPMHEMPSPDAVTRLIALRRCIEVTRNIYDTVLLRLHEEQPFEMVRAPLLGAITMAEMMVTNFQASAEQRARGSRH